LIKIVGGIDFRKVYIIFSKLLDRLVLNKLIATSAKLSLYMEVNSQGVLMLEVIEKTIG